MARRRRSERDARRNNSEGQATQSAGEVSDAVSEPALKKKRSCGGCVLILSLGFILLAAGLFATWYFNRKNSDDALADRIADATKAGQVTSVQELKTSVYVVPDGALNTTEEWQSAIDAFNDSTFIEMSKGIDIIGGKRVPPFPVAHWNEHSNAAALISDYTLPLLDLQIAATGKAIFDVDLTMQPQLSDETIAGLRRCYDMLELKFFVHAHEKSERSMNNSLMACLTFSGCLSQHPNHQAERLYFERRAMETLLNALGKLEFDKETLKKFRDVLLERNYWQPIHEHWDMQRALRFSLYQEPEKFAKSELANQLATNDQWKKLFEDVEKNKKFSPYSSDDGIKFLDLMNKVEANFEGPLFTAADRVAESVQAIFNEQLSSMDKLRYPTAQFLVPDISELIRDSGTNQALKNVVLVALAMDHDRIINGANARNPGVVAEDFLGFEPLDMYSGQSMLLQNVRGDLMIYSVGPNGENNKLNRDDIGVRIPRHKFHASDVPISELDE